jgi:SNF2 family DNA or RNA helicase
LNTLESKPDPCQKFTDFVSPKSLKVKLMPHQIYSMHWLKWRESNVPYGAILADDMGLGKTLTTLAYLRMVKDNYEKKHKAEQESDEEKEKEEAKKENDENEDEDDKENDFDEIKFLKKLTNKKKKFKINDSSKKLKTLIVLPASLLHQWQGEIENKFEKVCIFFLSFKVFCFSNNKIYLEFIQNSCLS